MKTINHIDLDQFEPGTIHKLRLEMIENALGMPIKIPLIIMKGKIKGPTFGVSAALHGNELNGIPVIHNLIQSVKVNELAGTIIALPVLNTPGYLAGKREFSDDRDLNRLMPGKPNGISSQVYCYQIVEKIVKKLDYLIDLHTASFGRINSLYVRADLTDPIIAKMAHLQEPDIIVNNLGEAGTLRKICTELGVKTITIELGDSHVFQKEHIRPSIYGIKNVLVELGMINDSKVDIDNTPVVCKKSFWLYSQRGGILRVLPSLVDTIGKGEVIATITDIYGDIIEEVRSPTDATLVAKSTNPVCHAGSRIVHLGVKWTGYETDEIDLSRSWPQD